MGAKRITGRASVALCSATVALILAIGSPAVAADGDSERGYPEVTAEWSAPNWYSATPAFNEYPRYPPAPTSDPSLERDGIHVTYYHPGGGAPGSGSGDLSLNLGPSGNTDSGRIDFSLLPSLAEVLSTEFIGAALLPYRPKHSLIGTSTETALPDVSFEGSTLVVSRPTCGVASLHTYESEFQVALLATNGFKYLADLRVSFHGKAKSKCAKEGESPEPSPTAKPESEKPAAPTPPKDEPAEPEHSAEDSKPEGDAEIEEEFDLWMILVATVILLGLLVIAFMRSRHQRAPAFDPDTYTPPLSRQPSTGAVSDVEEFEDA